jgi:hypothetical protein
MARRDVMLDEEERAQLERAWARARGHAADAQGAGRAS